MKKSRLILLPVMGIILAGFFYCSSGHKPDGAESGMTDLSQAPTKKEQYAVPPMDLHSEVSVPTSSNNLHSHVLTEPAQEKSRLDDFKRQYRRKKVEEMSGEINSKLADKGFSQAEIDQMVKGLARVWLTSEGSIDVASAVNQTAEEFKLNPERKNVLNDVVLSAVTNASGKVSFADFQKCMTARLAQVSDCSKEIGQELTEIVGAQAEGDLLTWQNLQSLEPERKEAVRKAVEICKEDPHKAEQIYSIDLQGCL